MVEPNDEKTFDAQFDIPELPPTHKDTKAVEISYRFKLEVIVTVSCTTKKNCWHKYSFKNFHNK